MRFLAVALLLSPLFTALNGSLERGHEMSGNSEIAAAEAKLNLHKNRLAQLQEEDIKYTDQINEIEEKKRLNNRQETILRELKEADLILKAAIEKVQQETSVKNGRMITLEAQKHQYEGALKTLVPDVDTVREQVLKLQKELSELRSQANNLNNQINTAVTDLTELENEKQFVDSSKETLQRKLEQSIADFEKVKKEDLRNRRRNPEPNIKEIEANSMLNSLVSKLLKPEAEERTKDELADEIKKYGHNHEELSKQFDTLLKKIVSLTDEIMAGNLVLSGLETEKGTIENSQRKLQKDLEELKISEAALAKDSTERKSALESEKKRLEADRDTLQSELDQLKINVEDLSGETQDKKETLKTLEADKMQSNNAIESLTKEFERKHEESSELQSKLKTFEGQVEDLKGQVKNLNGEKEQLNDQVQKLTQQIPDLDEEKKRKEGKLRVIEEELEKLHREEESCLGELEAKRNRVFSLKDHIPAVGTFQLPKWISDSLSVLPLHHLENRWNISPELIVCVFLLVLALLLVVTILKRIFRRKKQASLPVNSSIEPPRSSVVDETIASFAETPELEHDIEQPNPQAAVIASITERITPRTLTGRAKPVLPF